jgi:hypothetical protein
MIKAFYDAYHRFARFPLVGETFYVQDIAKEAVQRMTKSIVSERFGKILAIGQSGSGISAALRRLAQDQTITNTHHVIFFSAADALSITDIEPVDFLIVIWIKLICAMQERNIETPAKTFDLLANITSEGINTQKTEAQLAQMISLKMKTDPEFRHNIVKRFMIKTETMEEHISDLCWILAGQVHAGYRINDAVLKKFQQEDVSENILSKLEGLKDQEYKSELTFLRAIEGMIGELQTLHYKPLFLKHAWIEEKKDVLIVIDEINHLKREITEKIFFEKKTMLHALEAKMIFAFPLSLWHYPIFSDVSGYFRCEFIRPMSVYDAVGNYRAACLNIMKEAILKRIEPSLISDDAITTLIDVSGGLIGDLMNFMQNACLRAIEKKAAVIGSDIVAEVIDDKIDAFARVFDFAGYEGAVRAIIRSKKKTAAQNKDLIYLLNYGFILEYGDSADTVWYDAHPCLVFDRKS